MPTETIYTYLGWRTINNKLIFLSKGYSVGASEKMDVRLEGNSNNYSLVDPIGRDVKKDIDDTLKLLDSDFVSHKIMMPLISIAFLSPLNHFFKMADLEPKLVVFLIGRTGARKSTLSSLILSFFGDFNNANTPISFRDTANSIIAQTFALKDVLTVIDDFHPASKLEEQSMNKTAQMIMRGYGDRVGRSRLKSDSTLLPSKPPRGNAVITGEYPPDISESGTARYISVELREEDINLPLLSELQDIARNDSFKITMTEYIKFILSKNTSEDKTKLFVHGLRGDFQFYRDEFTNKLRDKKISFHPRIPETLAWLYIGFNYYLIFLLEGGYIDSNRVQELDRECEKNLLELAIEQSKLVVDDKPTTKFLTKLKSLLDSGIAQVESKDDPMFVGSLGFIGYQDSTYYYLHTSMTHKAVKKLCEEQGELFSISERALVKNLADEGFIETEKDKNTKLIRIADKTHRLLWIKKSVLESLIE